MDAKKPELVETVGVREIGGTMAPIWANFVEPGKTKVKGGVRIHNMDIIQHGPGGGGA